MKKAAGVRFAGRANIPNSNGAFSGSFITLIIAHDYSTSAFRRPSCPVNTSRRHEAVIVLGLRRSVKMKHHASGQAGGRFTLSECIQLHFQHNDPVIIMIINPRHDDCHHL